MNNMNMAVQMYVHNLKSKLFDYYTSNYRFLPSPNIRVEFGTKFVKIIVGTSAYAFIALQDFENKGLGKVKMGDLMKPASWNAPTKHARGNIIEDMDKAIQNSGPYGVAYLK